ncbi:MAG: threonylcarbamoyl-AMP synthase [Gammaproteobacteria bacterium]|nr:threonylcarbamoyl-AMP synthase [Gammaproteobacteria bacterium]
MIEIQSGPEAIRRAVSLLRAGELVAFPTETVYGLGADAGNPGAVAGIFAAKGRPQDHPLIVHVADPGAVGVWTADVPPLAERLMAEFWPGPLTLILRRSARVGDGVSGGQDTVGLRCPAHPLARALLAAARDAGIAGLAAPSANRFGRISPTSAADVAAELGTRVALILDGGRCEVGIESTIVDVTGDVPRLLRPGMIDADRLAAAAGRALAAGGADAPRVSGSLPAHYAPSTALDLVPDAELVDRAMTRLGRGESLAVFASAASVAILMSRKEGMEEPCYGVAAPASAAEYAHELYATLRQLDALRVSRLIIAEPPDGPEWTAVRDRLARAAHGAGH